MRAAQLVWSSIWQLSRDGRRSGSFAAAVAFLVASQTLLIASIVSGAAIGGALASITTVRPVIAPTAGDAPPMIFAGTTLDGRSLLLSVEDPSRRAMTDLETVEVRGSISIGAAVEAASTADADVDQVPSRPRP